MTPSPKRTPPRRDPPRRQAGFDADRDQLLVDRGRMQQLEKQLVVDKESREAAGRAAQTQADRDERAQVRNQQLMTHVFDQFAGQGRRADEPGISGGALQLSASQVGDLVKGLGTDKLFGDLAVLIPQKGVTGLVLRQFTEQMWRDVLGVKCPIILLTLTTFVKHLIATGRI